MVVSAALFIDERGIHAAYISELLEYSAAPGAGA
jgi:hypothetical protein